MEVCQRGKIKLQAKINKFAAIRQKHLRTPELSQVVSNAEGASGDTRHCVLDALREVNDSRNHFSPSPPLSRTHHHPLLPPKRFLPIPASDFERQSPGDRLRDLALPTGDVSFAYWRCRLLFPF
ncbi:hypothetical protein CDAR_537691 [Caerostris darwini]|uniref:Uncharacterized protein n=1 Tax=Caerostris darwini TaxID=1538125 RepID=A0AAV4UHJ3_9ARAC|nr:hypothetical protein CDAR_537691 [Caerostris darwini]